MLPAAFATPVPFFAAAMKVTATTATVNGIATLVSMVAGGFPSPVPLPMLQGLYENVSASLCGVG